MLVNPHRRTDRRPDPATPESTRFHRQLPGYHPTPLRDLADTARALGIRAVTMKDESRRLGLPAFKVLGASWAVEQLLRHDPTVRTLVAASAGNHGRAVAHCAATRGLACRIFLPAAASAERAARIAEEGAEVVRVTGTYEDAVAAAEQAAAAPGSALVADVSADPDAPTPHWVVDGYATLFREAADQLAAQGHAPATVVLVPVGVGSLAAAAVRWAAHQDPAPAVVAVEPATAACVTASLRAGAPVVVPTPGTTMAGMDCATPSAPAWPDLRDGLTGAVTVQDAQVHQVMRGLADRGLTVGDCGAAPLAALYRLVRDPDGAALRAATGLGPQARVLLVATEGATDPAAYQAVTGRPPTP